MRPAGGWWFEWCRVVSLFSLSRSFFTLPCDFFSGLYLPRASTAPLPLGCRQTWHSPQFFHFGVRPLFPLPLRPFFPPFFLQGAEENPPTTTPPPNPVRPSIPTPPSRHESLSRPIKQTTVKSVPVPAFVCVSVSTPPSPSARLASPVSLGLVLPRPGSLGFPRPRCSRLRSRNDIDRTVYSFPPSTLRCARSSPTLSSRQHIHDTDSESLDIYGRVYKAVISKKEFGIPARG